MTSERIFELMNNIDDDLILRAEKNKSNVYKKSAIWLRIGVAAAYICLAVIMVAALLPRRWADPTPPTPSGSDIFYNENGELDEDLIFQNLNKVIWDQSVTSPEDEKPLGKIYEWNGLRLEEELYNLIINAGGNDVFAVRAIYDGKKLYEYNNVHYQTMLAAQEALDQLKADAEKLERFKSEAEVFVSTAPTDDEMKAFYDKCAGEYTQEFADKYIVDGRYDGKAVEKALSTIRDVNIPNQENAIAENKIQADEFVLYESEAIFRRGNVLTAYPIKNNLVMFASKNVLDNFSKRLDMIFGADSDFVSKDEYVFTLSPKYLAEELDSMVNRKPDNDEPSPDPNEKTKFAFTKLKFYSTNEELKTIIKVIEEINKCYDFYDALTFTVTYSGKLPEEKLQAMKYSEIEQSKDDSTVTITVNYEDFDIEAMKALSCDKNVWRIFVSYPENAEMGFGKNKVYFSWPAVTGNGFSVFNNTDDIINRFMFLKNYPQYRRDDIIVGLDFKGDTAHEIEKNREYIYSVYELELYGFKINEFSPHRLSIKQIEIDDEAIELLKKISRDPLVTHMRILMYAPKFDQ